MGLPIIKHPTFELTIPSTKQKIKYRPFLVKEEKILLLAQSGEHVRDMIKAVQQILNNCIMEGDVNLDILPSFDIEYMFLQLRANSVNSIATLEFEEPETKKKQKVEVDLLKINVIFPENIERVVDLGDGISMSLKYPTYDDIGSIEGADASEGALRLIKVCVDKIYSGEGKVDSLSDYSDEEVTQFIDSLRGDVMKDIQTFFEKMPKLEHKVEYEVGTEKKSHTFSGIADFFTYA
jgi:hypothetical protein